MIRIPASEELISTTPVLTQKAEQMLRVKLRGYLEATSLNLTEDVICLNSPEKDVHDFLKALQLAFSNHKGIIIHPDHWWLLIVQGFSQHLKCHSDTYQTQLFGKEFQRTNISIRNDTFIKGGRNDWESVLPEYRKKIQTFLGPVFHKAVSPTFSSSGLKEKTAFEIAFMDTFSSYFRYEFVTLCGIPEIQLTGTKEDYIKLLESVKALSIFDLEWWVNQLVPIIQEFINAFDGQLNSPFWQSIFKQNNESGGPYITGWISAFFPYIQQSFIQNGEVFELTEHRISPERFINVLSCEPLHFNNLYTVNLLTQNPICFNEPFSFTLNNFPSGIASVPLQWEHLQESYTMLLHSGFIGITEKENYLIPEINWAITEIK